jgi:hypothetical protein
MTTPKKKKETQPRKGPQGLPRRGPRKATVSPVTTEPAASDSIAANPFLPGASYTHGAPTEYDE